MDIDFTRFFVGQNQKASRIVPYGPATALKPKGNPSPLWAMKSLASRNVLYALAPMNAAAAE